MKRLLFLVIFVSYAAMSYAAPKAVYDPMWDAYNNDNASVIDHSDFDDFLKKHVQLKNGITYIDYGAVPQADTNLLIAYVNTLEAMPILSYSQGEQQAYWINLYNALTIQLILDNYPVKSIKEIPSSFFKSGPWNKKYLTIEEEEVSLNDIEHRILRPLWQDARVHFLVNCASVGCPNIGMTAITAQNYEMVAEQASIDFINHPRAVSLKGDTLIFTSLVDWYGVDFGDNLDEIVAFFNGYANTATKAKLKNYESNSIEYEYDWNLNEAKNIQ